ncbi:MAG: CD0415/CD1112 family protein [Defluviitaleaceae bacterium]|nr:CD0415/CD1112 family protein [Defluviitaleaceae bacterium]
MNWLFDGIGDWLRQLFTEAIMAKFVDIFDSVNVQVGDIANQVGQTPAAWNAGVFAMIQNLSETVVLPIAGMFLTFVLCYELIQLIIEKNNLSDFDTFNIYKWIFKTFVAVFILTNTFNIVMAVFDMAQNVINTSADLIVGDTNLGSPEMLAALEAQLVDMSVGELLGVWLQVQIIGLCLSIMAVVIFIVIWGRMIEIYLTVSIAPIPLSTMVNREWGNVGNSYLKSLFAVAFQGFLIMVCVAIYAVLVGAIADAPNIHIAIWTVVGYTALLCFILLKTGGIAKSVFASS